LQTVGSSKRTTSCGDGGGGGGVWCVVVMWWWRRRGTHIVFVRRFFRCKNALEVKLKFAQYRATFTNWYAEDAIN
jgi:hypothetical protein